MKIVIDNQWDIDYIEHLINEDIKYIKTKLEKREKLLSTIKFNKEAADFN